MDGRLGNQLFRYAYARKLSIETNQPIFFNFKNVIKKNWEISINEFLIAPYENKVVKNRPEYLLKKFIVDIYRFKRKVRLFFTTVEKRRIRDDKISLKYAKKLEKYGIFFISEGFYNFNSLNHKHLILHGMFESSKYFDSIKEVLKIDLEPKIINHSNDKLIEDIRNSESVCVSIRRGDFLTGDIKKTHFVCDENYYNKAIQIIKEKLPEAKFFIFSDDIEWVKNNILCPEGSVFESGNDNVSEKLRVMKNCKNFILSNSTFSWWCQYLSENENKLVISPKRWSKIEYISDLIEEDWILI
ncbi:MAG: alpha-1,2-fucosyltransferase [Lachnospiraceae bacterium]|nr:alpha-1,2-fucosyltransferase [Lachnospiraceae bacterium]